LEKINTTMKRLGHSAVDQLPNIGEAARKVSTSYLFSKAMIATTILITAIYFLHVITLYFILKWTPNLVVGMGYPPYLAGEALTWASIGGALGCVFFGVLSSRFSLKSLTIFTFVMAWVFTSIFGRAPEDLTMIKFFCRHGGVLCKCGNCWCICPHLCMYSRLMREHPAPGLLLASTGVGRCYHQSLPVSCWNLDWTCQRYR